MIFSKLYEGKYRFKCSNTFHEFRNGIPYPVRKFVFFGNSQEIFPLIHKEMT